MFGPLMSTVTILGKPVTLKYGATRPSIDAPNAVIDMAAVIDGVSWSDAQDRLLTAMRTITVFRSSVPFGLWTMTRSFCDQKNATFYWLDTEIAAYPDPQTMACYYAHDCAHLLQYWQSGIAQSADDEVAREVAACDLQIEVAKAMNVPAYVVEFLTNYRNDPAAIKARIGSGEDRCARYSYV
jgi:hypothetical protein